MKEYGVSQSWTKLFVVRFDPFTTLFGYSQEGLLIVRNFLSANGELKRRYDHKCVSIDLETLQENDLGIEGILDVANFMENLVLLDRVDVVAE